MHKLIKSVEFLALSFGIHPHRIALDVPFLHCGLLLMIVCAHKRLLLCLSGPESCRMTGN
eukprot:2125973-Amphidinium_carterae.1